MKTFDCVQLSPEWWALRRGIPTASDATRIITPKTGKLSAQADAFICELLADLYCPVDHTEDGPQTPAMRHGTDCEPEARRYYSLLRDTDVERVGFCLSDCGRFGCSPDGLVGEDGLLELKCPTPKVHLAYLLDGTLPDDYRWQVQMQLYVTGRKWVDFLSYCAGLPALLVRVMPTQDTETIGAALIEFHKRFAAAKAKIDALRPEVAA